MNVLILRVELRFFGKPSEKGNVFIIEENQIHHINVNGKKDKYTNLINSIKER